LLFMPFAKALLYKTNWPLVRVFYMRRVLRILPAYYVSLFLLILFQHPEYLHRDHRSEEHTSELQSRFDLVCRLLLEKKKIQINFTINHLTPYMFILMQSLALPRTRVF